MGTAQNMCSVQIAYGKLGKGFTDLMIQIAQLKKLAFKNLLGLLKSLTCEDALAKRNKLRHTVYTR